VPPLLNFGIRAVGGAAAGIVHHFRQNGDVADIPPGAVIVTRQPRARLVQVMDRIAAIITEAGSPTDHMSILAREFRVPTLVEVGGAMRILQPGQIVTVDADAAMVYPGVIPELLQPREQTDEELHRAPVFQKLRQILKLAAPLNLIDPESPDFQAKYCRTLHDVTRFCHEKAMDAMFSQEVERALESKNISRLKTDLPLNLFILDLGGGLKVTGQATVEEEDIVSRPFKALLRGFHHPDVSWAGQVAPRTTSISTPAWATISASWTLTFPRKKTITISAFSSRGARPASSGGNAGPGCCGRSWRNWASPPRSKETWCKAGW
jgi:pyruvate,water dikinase